MNLIYIYLCSWIIIIFDLALSSFSLSCLMFWILIVLIYIFYISPVKGLRRVNILFLRGGSPLQKHMRRVIQQSNLHDPVSLTFAKDLDEKGSFIFLQFTVVSLVHFSCQIVELKKCWWWYTTWVNGLEVDVLQGIKRQRKTMFCFCRHNYHTCTPQHFSFIAFCCNTYNSMSQVATDSISHYACSWLPYLNVH